MSIGGSLLILDQSLSSSGFALWDGSDVTSGTWPLCESEAQRALGFRELFHRLDAMHRANVLREIVHEAPPLGTVNQGAGQIFGKIGLVAIIELFACSRCIAVTSYAVQSWRGTFFTKAERQALRGRDWKRPAILRCRQLGFDPATDDEAEAIAILDHHLLKQKITPPWRQGESAMLDPVA